MKGWCKIIPEKPLELHEKRAPKRLVVGDERGGWQFRTPIFGRNYPPWELTYPIKNHLEGEPTREKNNKTMVINHLSKSWDDPLGGGLGAPYVSHELMPQQISTTWDIPAGSHLEDEEVLRWQKSWNPTVWCEWISIEVRATQWYTVNMHVSSSTNVDV